MKILGSQMKIWGSPTNENLSVSNKNLRVSNEKFAVSNEKMRVFNEISNETSIGVYNESFNSTQMMMISSHGLPLPSLL